VLPVLGQTRVADLTHEHFERWLRWASGRRRKAKQPSKESKPTVPSPEQVRELLRRRRATLNRVISDLKACLNYAHATRKVASKEAWSRLQKYRSVDSARMRWLTIEEAQRLQNASATDLRPLVRSALLTGCRAGELLALRVADYDSRSRTLLIADSKSGRPRRVPLTDQGVELFEQLVAGRAERDRLFSRSDGSAWYRMAVARAMQTACHAGKIHPAATFHVLRHTYASHLVQAGVPLLFVASALGHSDTRMVERHYGHLAPSQVADMIRAKLPDFGRTSPTNVRRISGSRN
jgi:integrase